MAPEPLTPPAMPCNKSLDAFIRIFVPICQAGAGVDVASWQPRDGAGMARGRRKHRLVRAGGGVRGRSEDGVGDGPREEVLGEGD